MLKELLKSLLIVLLLTLLTQVGGVIYLFYKPIGWMVKKRIKRPLLSRGARVLCFFIFLSIFSLLVIPGIAKQFGRVALPIAATDQIFLKPGNFLTVLANRHYVKPALREAIVNTAKEVNAQFPGTKVIYLDANFPFFDEFPLLPHRSHDDGEKLDICFLYKNKNTGKRTNRAPTFLGYGLAEKPKKGEFDQPAACEEQGHWQYSIISKLTPAKKNYEFDTSANTQLLQILYRNARIRKIFIEPHLKQRLGLGGINKIRFHGCQAVRHDDHIHVQL